MKVIGLSSSVSQKFSFCFFHSGIFFSILTKAVIHLFHCFRSQIPYYVVLHISILLWASLVILLLFQFLYLIPYFLTHIILFIALFIASLVGSIKISKYKPLGVNSIQVAKLHQKHLYSFIIYAYSIEIITLPMFVHACAFTICLFAACEKSYINSNFKTILDTTIYFLYEMRTIIIVFITILAFEPYRSASFLLFHQGSWITKVESIKMLKTIETKKKRSNHGVQINSDVKNNTQKCFRIRTDATLSAMLCRVTNLKIFQTLSRNIIS
uniref:Uncharacterized protein n=1 Tax=Onchocerca volvulus TaxID=6282 RepID=A0A8R1TMZ4_ONCVO